MAELDKLQISGIRSFDHERPQAIVFQKPVTIITGHNGSGKTTVIEALRYACTSDMPPGSQKSLFVRDPKLCRLPEVHAKIMLQLIDPAGKQVVCTRAMQVVQRPSRVEFKTKDSVIKRVDDRGQPVAISTRCAEIDKEMIATLGVTRAVLNNVIFCHQEESNWPLAEPTVLKKKFDEIFAAKRYSDVAKKVLKDLRANYKTEVDKTLARDVRDADAKKQEAKELRRTLASEKENYDRIQSDIAKAQAELERNQERVEQLAIVRSEYERQLRNVESQSTKASHLEAIIQNMEQSVEEPFTGTTAELKLELDNYRDNVRRQERDLNEAKEDKIHIFEQLKTGREKFDELNSTRGALINEQKNRDNTVTERDCQLQSIASELGLEGYNSGSLSDDHVQRFRTDLARLVKAAQREKEQTEKQWKNKLQHLEGEVNAALQEKMKAEEQVRSLSSQIEKNTGELSQHEAELGTIRSSLSQLEPTEQRLEQLKAQREVKQLACDKLLADRKFDILSAEKAELESALHRHRSALKQAVSEGQVRTEVDMLRRTVAAKEEQHRDVLRQSEDGFSALFKYVPTRDFGKLTNDHLATLQEDLTASQAESQQETRDLDRLTMRRDALQKELEMKRAKVRDFENRVAEASAGSNDLKRSLAEIEAKIKDLRFETGCTQGAQDLYSKFLDQLKPSPGAGPGPSCPVCRRGFDQARQLEATRRDLRSRLDRLPSSLKTAEDKLRREEASRNKLIQLEPMSEECARVRDEIQTTEKELAELAMKIGQKMKSIDTLKSSIMDLQDLVKQASALVSVATNLDALGDEIDCLSADLAMKQSELGTSSGDMSIEQLQAAVDKAEKTYTATTNKLQQYQSDLSAKEKELAQLQEQISNLVQKVSDLRASGQREYQIKERIDSLKNDIGKHSKDLDQLRLDLDHRSTYLDGATQRRAAAMLERDSELRAHELKRGRLAEFANRWEWHAGKVEELMRKNIDERLQQADVACGSMQAKIERLNGDIEHATAKIERLDRALNNVERRRRDLETQQSVRIKKDELDGVQENVERLKRQMKPDQEIRQIEDEYRRRQTRLSELQSGLSANKGRREPVAQKIDELQLQLERDQYKNAEKLYLDATINLETATVLSRDLFTYQKALDGAILKFHSIKMREINKIIKELWQSMYRGMDIDYISIDSEADRSRTEESRTTKHTYTVMMHSAGARLEMRGRCSAGQKVLASLVIRMALAETFAAQCGILTLDEPTTNLDAENIESLAVSLIRIIEERFKDRKAQLIIITHDENFVDMMMNNDVAEYYYKVEKDDKGHSKLLKMGVESLNR